MITLYEKASSFARPSDTVTYASGDLVANSTTSGSIAPLSWAFPSNAPGVVRAVRLTIDKSDISNASFRLHLLNATPTFAGSGDNDAVGTAVATGYDKLLVAFEGTLKTITADGAAGLLVSADSVSLPILKKPTAAVQTTLYGYLEARGAYVPKSGSVITATLIFEK
jgi:hypothetical protein